jgi:hypothetical protein
MADDTVQVQTEGWNEYIGRQITARWPPVLRSWFPDDADRSLNWHWLFFQYVFPLADPRTFPTFDNPKWTDEEKSRLDRYVRHAADLAESTALTAQDGYKVSIPDLQSGDWEVEETKTARDATVGFLTMFRQCYSPDELASFKRVYDVVSREAHGAGMPPETMRTWKGAHNKMRGTHLDHLILVRANEDGVVGPHVVKGNAFDPEKAKSPGQMLSTIFYGDAIHWGDNRTVIEDWDREHPFWGMKRRFDALRAAVQLGHLYVGFAGIVGRATGALAPADL